MGKFVWIHTKTLYERVSEIVSKPGFKCFYKNNFNTKSNVTIHPKFTFNSPFALVVECHSELSKTIRNKN